MRKGWSKTRKAFLEKDLRFSIGNEKNVHVHHITRRTDGGSDRDRNIISSPEGVHREIHKADNNPKEKKFCKRFLRYYKDNPF